MSLNNLDRKELRRRVEKEVSRQKMLMRGIFFGVNLLLYVVFMIIGWGLFLTSNVTLPPVAPGQDSDPVTGAMIMLSVAGFIGVLFQFIALMVETNAGSRQIRDRAMARILSEQLLDVDDEDAADEKEKRAMRLSDDGELEEVAEDEIIDEVPQARQQRR